MRYALRAILFGLLIGAATAGIAQTPPVQPKVEETPLPPPVVVPAPASVPPDVPNRPLTADEAAAVALRHQPSVLAAQAGVLAAEGRRRQAQSGALPTLGASAGYTHAAVSPTGGATTGGSAATGTLIGYQVAANVRQLIYDFNRTRDLIRQAGAEIQSADHSLTRVQSDLVFQVKQAFYTYVQNVRLEAVNEANVHNQQSHLASAQARLDAGLGLPPDVVRAQTAVASAVFDLNLARNNASVARVNLALLMGIDPRTPITSSESDEPQVDAHDLDALMALALQRRPEMLQAMANIDAAKFALGAARTGDAPSLGATVGWQQRAAQLPLDNNLLTYGVNIQWTPFDSGLTRGRIDEARANLQSSEAQLESTRLTVISDITQAFLNLTTAEQRVITADSETANAEEAVRLAVGRYQAGLGIFLDVLDAQTALLTAQTNRINTQSAVNQARAAMARAVGPPAPKPAR